MGAGGTTADAGADAQIFHLGETAHALAYDLMVIDVEEATVGGGVCPIESFYAPKPGNRKLGVQIQITATSGEVSVNPFYAKLTDSAAFEYTSAFGGCEPELASSKISPPQSATGWITFEIPQTATGLTFFYGVPGDAVAVAF